MKAAVRFRAQLRDSFIHSGDKLQGGQSCREKEADQVPLASSDRQMPFVRSGLNH
jgi:hypothetical protein